VDFCGNDVLLAFRGYAAAACQAEGAIAVNSAGRRFVDESIPWYKLSTRPGDNGNNRHIPDNRHTITGDRRKSRTTRFGYSGAVKQQVGLPDIQARDWPVTAERGQRHENMEFLDLMLDPGNRD
jgi:hypothetical protein